MAQTKVQLLQPDLGDVIDFDASTLFVDGADNRIGIRNTNPQYELDVTGTINATNFRGNISVGTIDDWITHTGDTNTKLGFPAADEFEVHAGGGPKLRITSAGQTLINQTAALNSSVMLGVKNPTSNDTVVDVVCGNTTAGSHIAFSDTAYASGLISYNHANNFLAFRTNGVATDRLHITSSGVVVVGHTAATTSGATNNSKFNIVGNISSATGEGQLNLWKNSAPAVDNILGQINFCGATTGDPGAVIKGEADLAWDQGGDTSDHAGRLTFFTVPDNSSVALERLRINSYGQVGINTTSPGANLGVAVDSSNTNVLATGGVALNLKNKNTTDNSWVSMDFQNSAGGIVGRIGAQFKDTSDKDTDLYFATRADGGSLSERLRITSDGNMGFGNAGCSNPGADPAIGNDATVFEIRQTTSGNITSGNNRKGAVLRLKHEAQWENGYQSSSPNDDLGRIEFVTGDNSSGEGVRSAIRCRNLSYFNSHDLTFETFSSGSLNEKLRITSAGALLVGLTSPTYNSGDMQHEIKKNNSRTYTAPVMTGHSHLLLNNSDTTNGAFTGLGFRAGSGDGSIGFVYRGSANNADFVINTDANANGKERFRIYNNGAVLIGDHATEGGGSARLSIDCEGLNIFDGVGDAANYGLIFANDPTSNKANGIGFFNDSGSTCGGYIVHQDKGGSNIGDLVFGTASTADSPVERLRIYSSGESAFSGPVQIQGGTFNASQDATLKVTATNNNDWGIWVNKYSGSANEYGINIDIGKNAALAYQIRGDGSQTYSIDGAGVVTHNMWADAPANFVSGGLTKWTQAVAEYHYTWAQSGNEDYYIDLTCGSYFHAEFIYTSDQSNSGHHMQQYARGKWANNHTTHTGFLYEFSGKGGSDSSDSSLTTTITVSDQSGSGSVDLKSGLSSAGAPGATYRGMYGGGNENSGGTNNGRLRFAEDKTNNSGSVANRSLIVKVYYGSFSISKSVQ